MIPFDSFLVDLSTHQRGIGCVMAGVHVIIPRIVRWSLHSDGELIPISPLPSSFMHIFLKAFLFLFLKRVTYKVIAVHAGQANEKEYIKCSSLNAGKQLPNETLLNLSPLSLSLFLYPEILQF